jgi:hypothetical protein
VLSFPSRSLHGAPETKLLDRMCETAAPRRSGPSYRSGSCPRRRSRSRSPQAAIAPASPVRTGPAGDSSPNPAGRPAPVLEAAPRICQSGDPATPHRRRDKTAVHPRHCRHERTRSYQIMVQYIGLSISRSFQLRPSTRVLASASSTCRPGHGPSPDPYLNSAS